MEKMRNRANIISLITTIRHFSNAGDVKDGGNVFLSETSYSNKDPFSEASVE